MSDTNGDGYDDVVVNGWLSSGYPGPTFLFFGRPTGPNPNPTPVTLDASNDRVVSGGGDVNGDGYTDFVATDVGTDVLLFFGGASGPSSSANASRSNDLALGAAL